MQRPSPLLKTGLLPMKRPPQKGLPASALLLTKLLRNSSTDFLKCQKRLLAFTSV